MQQQVRVPLDETRQERRARQSDSHRVGGHGHLSSRPHRLDAFSANEHHPTVVRRVGDGVPYSIGHEQRRRADGRRGSAASPSTLRDDDGGKSDGGESEQS